MIQLHPSIIYSLNKYTVIRADVTLRSIQDLIKTLFQEMKTAAIILYVLLYPEGYEGYAM